MLTDFLARFGAELWAILLDTGVWLILGLLLAGVVHTLVPRSFMARHLAGSGTAPVLKASLLGIPLPLCSCSVIPVAAGLRGSGASKGASAAFAISTPQTGEESVPLTWALFGPVYALARPVLAVATAFTAGTLIDRLVGDATPGRANPAPNPEPNPFTKSCCGGGAHDVPPPPDPVGGCCSHEPSVAGSCCHEPEPASSCCHEPKPPAKSCCHTDDHAALVDAGPTVRGRVAETFRYGFGTLLNDLAPWLAVGLLLSALIAALIPPGWIESTIGTGIVPMLLMLLVGLPLYVCATSTTPLAYSLVVAGLSPGAGLVLLLAGPATNAATMSWVLKDLGARALAIYLATIAVFAVAGGLAFDAFLSGTLALAEQGIGAEHTTITLIQGAAAGLLAVLMLWALAERYLTRFAGPAGSPQPEPAAAPSGAFEQREPQHHG